jgi:hypothetical protein
MALPKVATTLLCLLSLFIRVHRPPAISRPGFIQNSGIRNDMKHFVSQAICKAEKLIATFFERNVTTPVPIEKHWNFPSSNEEGI